MNKEFVFKRLQDIFRDIFDEDTLVVVPFSGSGSECVAAKLEGINYIGFEINEDYVNLSNTRLENTVPDDDDDCNTIDIR